MNCTISSSRSTRTNGDYFSWLTKQTRPVFLRDEPPAEFKHGVQFPLGEILEHYKDCAGATYLTNTVSLMIALALFEHDKGLPVSEIGLWGINMAQAGVAFGGGHAGWFTSEYARQRPSVEYWLGLCNGRGIKVTLPEQTDIMRCSVIYGYHTTARAAEDGSAAQGTQRPGHQRPGPRATGT